MNRAMTSGAARGIETVYVVDDDASMRKALERMFRTAGFAVETFDSAASFLAHGEDPSPCCAVLDVRMPAVDGLALHARLKDAGRALPVVFITGHGDVTTGVRAMKTGAIDFIEKPFSDEDLLAAVRLALDASQAERLHKKNASRSKENQIAHSTRARSLRPRRAGPAEQGHWCASRCLGENDQNAPWPRHAQDGSGVTRRSRAHGRASALDGVRIAFAPRDRFARHGTKVSLRWARAGPTLMASPYGDCPPVPVLCPLFAS